jgi:hypothetical protein
MQEKAAGAVSPHGRVKAVASSFYTGHVCLATSDIGDWRSIGELSRDVLVKCFVQKYRIRPALGRTIHELAGFAKEAA